MSDDLLGDVISSHPFVGIVCPISKEPLLMNKDENWLYCITSNLAYPIKNKIPVMLPSEARILNDNEYNFLKSYINND